MPSRSNARRTVSSCTSVVMIVVDHFRSFSFALLRLCTTGNTVSWALLCDSSLYKGFVVVVAAVLCLYFDARGILVKRERKKIDRLSCVCLQDNGLNL